MSMKINDLNKLFYFKEAAEFLNYTKAAKKLQASPSGIQQAVRALENSLGHRLFVRKSKGLALTPYGKLLYDRVIKSFKELNMAEKELALIKQKFVEKIKIFATPGLAAEWVYMSFPLIKQQYPDLMIEFLTTNYDIAIDAGDFDIYIGPEIEMSPEYKSRYLTSLHFRLYASKDYIEKNGKPNSFGELKNHTLIRFSGVLQAFFTDAEGVFTEVNDEQIYNYVVDQYLVEYNLVQSGQGIGCVTQELAGQRRDDLIDIFEKMKPIIVKIYIHYRRKVAPQLIDTLFNALNTTYPF